MVLDSLSYGATGVSRFTGGVQRSLSSQALGAIRYPSPFFDIAHMYLPTSFKSMLRWCRYYFLTNPLINSVVYKMAEYPVTDLIFDTDNSSLHARWKDFFDNVVQFKKFLVEAGLDYYCYGNTFISIFYPFRKHLVCKRCRKMVEVQKQDYTFREFKFNGTCQHCGHYGDFGVKDIYIRSLKDIRLIRWNPEFLNITHNDATGESEYYYTIPPLLANDIRMAKRHVLERVPQIFIEALRENKALKFDANNLFHMKRPTIAQKDKGWGLPMIMPVLKDTFYLQILRKAQEAISIEHIVPLRILFPQAASASSDVYQNVNLVKWRNTIEKEIMRWRVDNNYIPIMPLPVGQQTLGGDGRALSLSQEYRVWSEHIIAGMGVPTEFIYGGLSYSGSNVSMRMLENHFLEDRSNHLKLVTNFIMPNIGAFMGWEKVPCHFRRFKMADDLQRNAFYLQLNQAGKLSDKDLLEEIDFDALKQARMIAEEQKLVLENQRRQALAQASIQGESQLTMQKYQARAQKAMQLMLGPPPGAPPGVPGPDGALPPAPEGQPPPGSPEGGPPQPNDQGQMGAPLQPGMAPLEGGPAPMGGEAQSPLGGNNDLMTVVNQIVAWLDQLPDNEKAAYLEQLKQKNPELQAIVMQMLHQRQGAHSSSASKAKPEQRAPRRGPEAAQV